MADNRSQASRLSRIETVDCYLFGERIDLPKPIVDEFTRLRALERQFQDEERERMLREWEAKHGPLPEPPSEPMWVPVEDIR